MEETGFSEKKLLMKENVRKYGSMSSAGGKKVQNNITFIRHEILVSLSINTIQIDSLSKFFSCCSKMTRYKELH